MIIESELWYITTPQDGLVITDAPEQYEGEATWSFPVSDPHFKTIDALEAWLESCRRVGQKAMYDINGMGNETDNVEEGTDYDAFDFDDLE